MTEGSTQSSHMYRKNVFLAGTLQDEKECSSNTTKIFMYREMKTVTSLIKKCNRRLPASALTQMMVIGQKTQIKSLD